MAPGIRWRLAAMMALVYGVWGAWWPLLAVHLRDLGIDGRPRGWLFATLALASIATPLGAGQIADRLVQAQRLLALLSALGAGVLVLLAIGVTSKVGWLFVILLSYWLLTASTSGLASALAFRNLERPGDQFGGVRLWGTIGWMAAGWVTSLAMAIDGSTGAGRGAFESFWVAAGISIVLAAYAMSLPHTPPSGGGRLIDKEAAVELFRRPGVAVLLACAFCVSLTTPFVYQVVPPYLPMLGLPRHWIASAMTIGQVLEVGALAMLPTALRRFGTRSVLTTGIAAWAAYYAIMASRPPLWVALLGLTLNGVAIAFFHVAAMMFLDGQAPVHRRASVQGLYLLLTSGVGSLLGNIMAGEIVALAGGVGPAVFVVPGLINLTIALLFASGFRPAARASVEQPAPRQPLARGEGMELAVSPLRLRAESD